jgi:hypothetical protein
MIDECGTVESKKAKHIFKRPFSNFGFDICQETSEWDETDRILMLLVMSARVMNMIAYSAMI